MAELVRYIARYYNGKRWTQRTYWIDPKSKWGRKLVLRTKKHQASVKLAQKTGRSLPKPRAVKCVTKPRRV